jgi:hypothetical protein
MTGCGSDMVNGSLDDLEGALHGAVQHRDRITEATCMLEPFKDRPKPLEGVVVVEQGLSQRFFGETCSKSFSFLDVGQCLFMGSRQ